MIEAVECKYIRDWVLRVKFNDGTLKEIDLQDMIKLPAFENWQNKQFFSMVRIEYGAPVWPDDTDIAPEYIYENGASV